MSDLRQENVSAMIDGEFDGSAENSIDELLQTPSLKDCWGRYHLIRDCLQQQLPESVDIELASRISASLEKEPYLLAPSARPNYGLLKPVAGFAIAASVAAMAILGIQHNQEPSNTVEEQQVSSFVPQKPVNSVNVRQASLTSTSDAQLAEIQAITRARLNSYLVNHNEFRTNSGFQGMLPHAKTVSFENGQ